MFDFKQEAISGVLFGIGFIVMNMLFGISIGFPLLGFTSLLEKYGIVSILAPIGEELIWGSLLIVAFCFLPRVWMYTLLIVSFTAFHYVAYGASFAYANASFIGAGIYRLIATTLVLRNHPDTSQLPIPISAIVAHIIINTYLVVKLTGFVIVGA